MHQQRQRAKALKFNPLTFHVEQKSNLNPKSWKGKTNMNAIVKKSMNDLAEAIRRQTLDEVVDMLWKKNDAISKVLDNGYNVLETAYGERFTKLYEKRSELRKKAMAIIDTIGIISEMRFK